MLHLLAGTLFLSLSLLAQSNDSLCIQKLQDSNSLENNILSLSVDKNLRLYFKTIPKNQKIVKFNPFLSLYLTKTKKGFRYPFELKESSNNLVLLLKQSSKKIKIRKHQIGLNSFAQSELSSRVISPIVSKCCKITALNTPYGIIEYPYLHRFLNTKKIVIYSDIGIRLDTQNKVIAIDPFHMTQIKKGDKIISFDNKLVKSSGLLMQNILFSHLNSIHKLIVKRDGIEKEMKIISYKRYGGGFVSDTFLEQQGIYFTQSLFIKNLTKNAKKYHLKAGDKILQVNNFTVKTQKEVRQFISEYKNFITLLIQRDGFQFFVKII